MTLIVIEGLDGSGKRTLTEGLRAALAARGQSVATLAFPRYGESVTADLAREALHGGHGDLAESVYAMAVLFALDRAAARGRIAELRAGNDVVILDRYVGSNAAYCAARLHQDAAGEMVGWIGDLEYGRLGLPEPDHQILLDVPVELAAERARRRAGEETDRVRDAYERDEGLQQRTAAVYAGLAAAGWHGPWSVVAPDVNPVQLASVW
ncbi:MAG: dTMP kinase [Mycobacteriaceae bacterium]|nr:dTMP kinase [Mycobacteriaceae bacterium]